MSIKQGNNYIAGGGSGANIDNLSITKNSSDELQTVGVINSRDSSTAIKTWTGTKAQYDAIASKDPNTLYNITDDTDISLSILQALYPVGSVYMSYNNVCPLQTLGVGTWTLESSGIVTSVDTNVPVKGNGMTLGMTNGTNNVAPQAAQPNWGYTGYNSNAYGLNLNQNPSSTALKTGIFGVTTDESKSGIVGTVTRSVSTINIFRRTA